MKRKEIVIKITNKCDKNCSHCCENSTINGLSMPFDLVKISLKKISQCSKTVGITGGEPLLYEDGKYNFLDVYKEIKKNKLILSLITGGVRNNNKYKKIINFINKQKDVSIGLSFNLFKSDWKEVFETTLQLIKPKLLSVIKITYLRKYKGETKEEFRKLQLRYPILKSIEVEEFPTVPIGRAKQFFYKDRKFKFYCNKTYEPLININGKILPCCYIVDREKLTTSFPSLTVNNNIDDIIKESELFCRNSCPFKNNFYKKT